MRAESHSSVSPGRRGRRGLTLIEILVALTLILLIAGLGVPSLLSWSRALRLRMAASEVVAAMQAARLYAVRQQRNVALRFRTAEDGGVSYVLYRDGDGDGVRNDDLARGRDPQVGGPRSLSHFGRLVRFGFPPGVVPVDPGTGRPLERLEDPIRFNRSDLASWSPLGTATPGSIYLTDGASGLVAVRVNHRAGRMRVLVYDAGTGTWRRD